MTRVLAFDLGASGGQAILAESMTVTCGERGAALERCPSRYRKYCSAHTTVHLERGVRCVDDYVNLHFGNALSDYCKGHSANSLMSFLQGNTYLAASDSWLQPSVVQLE
ncbi:MAG: hypothetical protein LBU67_04400 [Oscillospiraceae bacterium]|jgi:hypothetical protein|nr:hypothetical protein [Oscillospiraceae bacterium]